MKDIRYNKGVAVSALLENTRFENTKSFKRYLSDWGNGRSAHTVLIYPFPYHHYCCMVKMRSDGRWLRAMVHHTKRSKKNVCVLFFYMKTGYTEKWRGWKVSGKYEARQIINMVVVMHIVLHMCNGITIFGKSFRRGPTWWNYLLLL